MRDIDTLPPTYIEEMHRLIGRNVQIIRKRKKISQLKLSIAIGHTSVSVVSCAEIFHNNIHFNIEHLLKIAYVLDCDISEFFKPIEQETTTQP